METSLHAVHVDSQSVAGSGTVSGVTASRTYLLFGDLLPSMDSATGVPVLGSNKEEAIKGQVCFN